MKKLTNRDMKRIAYARQKQPIDWGLLAGMTGLVSLLIVAIAMMAVMLRPETVFVARGLVFTAVPFALFAVFSMFMAGRE